MAQLKLDIESEAYIKSLHPDDPGIPCEAYIPPQLKTNKQINKLYTNQGGY